MLPSCMETAHAHTRPGGVAVFVPDYTRETFAPAHLARRSRRRRRPIAALPRVGARDPDPADTTYAVDFAVLLREPGQEPRVVHDHHVEGSSPSTPGCTCSIAWASSRGVVPGDPDDEDALQPVFVARRPADR